MITSKERAELRSMANTLDTTVIIGKSGVSESLVSDTLNQLNARELIKCKVLETALLSAEEASQLLCEATGAEGIQIVGNKFVIWKKSEKKKDLSGTAKSKTTVNPVKTGIKRRRAAMKEERERRNTFFKEKAIEASIERSKAKQKREW